MRRYMQMIFALSLIIGPTSPRRGAAPAARPRARGGGGGAGGGGAPGHHTRSPHSRLYFPIYIQGHTHSLSPCVSGIWNYLEQKSHLHQKKSVLKTLSATVLCLTNKLFSGRKTSHQQSKTTARNSWGNIKWLLAATGRRTGTSMMSDTASLLG